MQARRKSTTPQPVKPRVLLYSRSISDQDELEQDQDWKVISYSQVSGKSLSSCTFAFNQCFVSLSLHHIFVGLKVGNVLIA